MSLDANGGKPGKKNGNGPDSMETPASGHVLREAGRRPDVPFCIDVVCDDETLSVCCTEVVRSLPAKRLTCFGVWNSRPVVVKIFLDAIHAKRHWERERAGVAAMNRFGLQTPSLLFAGRLSAGRAFALGFERLLDARDFAAEWRQCADDTRRIRLLSQAAGAIAAQHQAGLSQNDAHWGNFLIRGEQIVAVDGDAVDHRRAGQPLSETESLNSVARFFAQSSVEHDALLAAAFEQYEQARGWPADSRRLKRLLRAVRARRKWRKKRYLRKKFRESTDHVCRKSWRRFLVCDRKAFTPEMSDFLENPDPVIARSRLLKDGNSSTLALVDVNGRRLAVKRYNIKNIFHRLSRCARPSRAWGAWRNSHLLRFIRIQTPRPVAFMEIRWGWLRSGAYFITEYTDGDTLADRLTDKTAGSGAASGVIHDISKLFQSLVNHSISHGDLKASNFIVSPCGVFITDLDAMKEHRFRWRFLKAFARDRKRFMKNWLNQPALGREFESVISQLNRDMPPGRCVSDCSEQSGNWGQ